MHSLFTARRLYGYDFSDDCLRVFVERLWPRGVRKGSLRVDMWARGLAPSDELRRWFSHDPAKWEEFKRRYYEELRVKEALIRPLCEEAKRRGCAVLLYTARDEQHNNAVALAEYLENACGRSAALDPR